MSDSFSRRAFRLSVYGLRDEDYEDAVEHQHGLCAICGERPSKPLSIDHDHDTGELRGLLCDNCNHMLGHAKDNPKILRWGAEYLENPPGIVGHKTVEDSPWQEDKLQLSDCLNSEDDTITQLIESQEE